MFARSVSALCLAFRRSCRFFRSGFSVPELCSCSLFVPAFSAGSFAFFRSGFCRFAASLFAFPFDVRVLFRSLLVPAFPAGFSFLLLERFHHPTFPLRVFFSAPARCFLSACSFPYECLFPKYALRSVAVCSCVVCCCSGFSWTAFAAPATDRFSEISSGSSGPFRLLAPAASSGARPSFRFSLRSLASVSQLRPPTPEHIKKPASMIGSRFSSYRILSYSFRGVMLT